MSVSMRLQIFVFLFALMLMPQSVHAADQSVSLSFASGWTNYAGGYRPVSAIKSSNVVTVSGLLRASKANGWGKITTLPQNMRPKQRLIFNVNNQDKTARVDVLPNGDIVWIAGGHGHGFLSLDGIAFDINKGTALRLSGIWSAYGTGYRVPSALKTGNSIKVSGLLRASQGHGWGKITTLPHNMRPKQRLIFNVNNNANTARVDVLSNGDIVWVAGGHGHGFLSLDGIAFDINKGTALRLPGIWSAYGTGYRAPSALKTGNSIKVSGLLRASQGHGWGKITTLPQNMRPKQRLIFNVNNNANTARVDVLPNGDIVWVAGGHGHGFLSLDGISFYQQPGGSSVVSTNNQPKPPALKNVRWAELKGQQAIDVSVSSNGSAYVANTNGSVSRWDGKAWINFGGNGITRLAAGPKSNIWAIANGTQFWQFDGKTWKQHGTARDVAVGADGSLWTISTNKQGNDYQIWRKKKNKWAPVSGAASRIAVDPKGNAWVVNSRNEIYQYVGNGFQKRVGKARDIGIGADGAVWIVGKDYAPYQWNGKGWNKLNGAITGISVGPKGYPWAVNGAKTIYSDKRSVGYKNPPNVKPPKNVSSTSVSQSDVETDLNNNPAFSNASLTNVNQNNGILTANMRVGSSTAKVVAWRTASGKPAISALIVPKMSVKELLPNLASSNKMGGYDLKSVVVFTVPSGAQVSNQLISALPRAVADEMKKTDPAFKEPNAEISLDPGMTYFGVVQPKGIVNTAFDLMGLKDIGLAGSLALTGYSAPQNTVTLTARLEKDPLKTVMGPIQVITVDNSANPSLYVTATGSTAIEVGYSSTFKIFNQVLDGKMFFAASGTGTSSETSIDINLFKGGQWREPHLFAPVKARNITLTDADITLERVIKSTGHETVISVVTENTKIHSTTYKPAAFSFSLEGTSNLPKAVFVDLATSKITVKQMAELGEVALQLTPQGQFASAVSPYKSSTIIRKLQLDKLPMDAIAIHNPKIFLGTVGAKVPELDPVPNPFLPPIVGAGIHLRGEFKAFGKGFGKAEFQLDYNGLHTDVTINALKMGPFNMGTAQFKIDAKPGHQPIAMFSGDASFAGITLAAAEFDLKKDKFSYMFDTGCAMLPPAYGLLKFTARGSSSNLTISSSMFGDPPKPGTCIPDALELLSNALKQGTKLVALGSDVVVGISGDTWKGLADGANGVLTSNFVNTKIRNFGGADKAASALADTGKKAAKKLGDSIKSIFGSNKSHPKPRYKNEPGDCRSGEDSWSIEYATCWRSGHEMIRFASDPSLCIGIRKRIREKGKAIELQKCVGGWHQQWKYKHNSGINGSVTDGWHDNDWCWDRKGDARDPKIGQRLESKKCNGKLRQIFEVDHKRRIKYVLSGMCLEAFGNVPGPESEIQLRSCSDDPRQKWEFVKQSSFPFAPSPPPPLPRLQPRNGYSQLQTATGRCIVSNDPAVRVGNCKQTAEYKWSWDGGRLKVLGNGTCMTMTKIRNNNILSRLGHSEKKIELVHCKVMNASKWIIRKINRKVMISFSGLEDCLTYSNGDDAVKISTCNRARSDQHFRF